MLQSPLTAQQPQPFVRDPEDRDRRGIHEEDQGIHDRAVLQLAARRLPAGIEDRADAEGSARRRRRRARQAAVRRRGLPVHAHAREGEPAREGLLDRQDRRRARDDRRRGRVGSDHGEAGGQPRPARQARRPAHDQHGRRAGREAARRHGAGLLHHRHDPLARNRIADGVDGARLPARRRRPRVHQVDPRQPGHADHAGRRSRRPQQDGRRLQVAPRQPGQELSGRWSTGASTSRTTTTATRWA